MLALTHLLQGLIVTHVTLLVFLLIGSAAFPWCDWDADFSRATYVMIRVACTAALGMSLVGLALFFAGLIGWLTPAGIATTLVALFAAGCAFWRNSPVRYAFWRNRGRALIRCWNVPLAVVYVCLIAIGTRAVIPDATGYSDAIYYHLAYAQDWANAGRITVDPFLFFPFYANNFILLYAAWMAVGAGLFVHFLTWSTGLIAALGLYAAIDDYAAGFASRPARITAGLLAVFAVIVAPIFLDYAVLGYIDVQIGTAALTSVIAMQLAIRERRPGWLVVSAIVASFLIGMKASFLLLVPVFVIALAWAARTLDMRRAAIASLLVLFCALSAPWYVRNTILAGDPIAPTLNIALHGSDGLWAVSEWDGLWSDMQTSRKPKAFLTLPIRAYVDPSGADFREYGATGLIVFLFVPTIAVALALLLKWKVRADLLIPVFVLTAFIGYWFVTSSLLRYALLLYPLLALCFAMVLLEVATRWPKLIPVVALAAVFAAFPNVLLDTGTIGQFTRNDVLGDWHELVHYQSDRAYLEKNDDGYSEAEVAMDWIHRHGGYGKVYVISNNAFDYYFRRQGIMSIGTWGGPAGYFRLFQALNAGEAAGFLDDLGTRAVLMSPQHMIDANVEYLLAEQLRKDGYKRVPLDANSDYQLYVRG